MHILRNWLAACLLALPLAVAAESAVNINTADSEALVDGLHGVGPHKALAIVRYRQQHGDFQRIEDLALVNGIGARTVEQNRARIKLGEPGDHDQ